MKKAFAALLFLLLFGCAPKPRNNVILIAVDTLRQDHVGTYNPEKKDLTPHIDALLADSVVFRNAFSAVPITLASFSSAFTGLYPIHHGVHFNDGYYLPRTLDFLPERFQKNGYYTAAAIGGRPLRSGKGFDRGFEVYQNDFLYRPATKNPLFDGVSEIQQFDFISNRPGMDVATVGMDLLRERKDRPVFLFLHFWDPHGPYAPPKDFKAPAGATPYGSEVAYVDSAIGVFLDYLKKNNLYDDALILFFADHGEGLGDHGEAQHSFYLYDSTVAVPLGFKLPLSRRSTAAVHEVSDPVCLTDLFPTVCDLMRLPAPAGIDGRSLVPLMKGGPAAPREIFLETEMPELSFGWEKIHGLIRWPFKAVVCSEPQVFNLKDDPKETHGLYPQGYADMNTAVAGYLRAAVPDRPSAIRPEEARILASLGYLTSSGSAKGAPKLPPSKWGEFIEVNRQGDVARWSDDYPKAIRAYTDFIQRYPGTFRVYLERAQVYLNMNDLPAAQKDFETALSLNPDNWEVYDFLLRLYWRNSDFQHFRSLTDLVRKKFPDYLFLNFVVDDLLLDSKGDEALALLRKAMQDNPRETGAYLKNLNTLLSLKKEKEADAFAAQVIAEQGRPRTVSAYFKGMQAMLKGDQAKALGFFNDACFYGADFYQPYYYSGTIYRTMKDYANASRYLNAARIMAAEDPQIHYEWADSLALQGKLPEALSGFMYSEHLYPMNPVIHIAVMKAAWFLGQKEIAGRELQWLTKNGADVLEAVRKQDPILQKMLQ